MNDQHLASKSEVVNSLVYKIPSQREKKNKNKTGNYINP